MEPVSSAAIMKMKEEYERTFRKSSTENLKKKFPARPWIQEVESAWISKKELLALLEDNKANGLRIHYGCHHESTHKDPKLDYHGLHNVILVATLDSVNPDNPTMQNSVDQLKDTAKDEHPMSTLQTTGAYTGKGGDLIPLCPPNCP
ncbi:MAG: hypothetical protein ABI863_15365 [Ginsengibacter sp.]